MKTDLLDEPYLEFGQKKKDIDIRRGIRRLGAFDSYSSSGPREIRLGVVGTVETIEGVAEWLSKCQSPIPAKPSNQPNLYTEFPGFNSDSAFRSKLVYESTFIGHIKIPQIEVNSIETRNRFVDELTAVYENEISELAQKKDLNVIICAPSIKELEIMSFGKERRNPRWRKKKPVTTANVSNTANTTTDTATSEDEDEDRIKLDFHDLLKARVMKNRQPIQLVLPATYDETKKRKQKRFLDKDVTLQDEATRAWNFFTALYYKSTGIPWRLVRESTEPATCYVGISFFRTLDKSKTYASSAQVFNELGEGVIVRGGEARYSKDDKATNLDRNGAYELLQKALQSYWREHHHYPARIVLHKSSKFKQDELEGFMDVLSEKGIERYDFVNLDGSFTRLFRVGIYPPVRGTWLELEENSCLLYACGSVPYYETYQGKYPPRTLKLNKQAGQQSLKQLALETLALTKMNWNSTHFDELYPITLRAARQVGSILKYLENATDDEIKQFYRYYM